LQNKTFGRIEGADVYTFGVLAMQAQT